MLRAIVRTSSSKICTTRTTATSSSLYRSTTLRTFSGGAVENNNKESAFLKANSAILDAEQLVKDHQMRIKDLSLRMTKLKLAMESPTNDVQKILTDLQDLKEILGVASVSPSRKECTFPTEVTALLLKRYGGKPSVWMGRYLRFYQMKMLKYQVNSPRDVSDWAANHTLARAIIGTIVLGLFIYL